MKPIACVGHRGKGCNDGGSGEIVGSSSHFTVRGRLAALDGDSYRCRVHGMQKLIATSHFEVSGKKLARMGDKTTCGATIFEGAEGTEGD